jgi:hypothetical protein
MPPPAVLKKLQCQPAHVFSIAIRRCFPEPPGRLSFLRLNIPELFYG